MVGGAIANLFAVLGYKVDDKGLKQFENSLKDVGKSLAIINGAVAGAIYGLNQFVAGTVANTTAMQDFNNQTGLSIDKLQEWQRVAQLTELSISAEEVTSSIIALQKQLVKLKMGQGDATPFYLLGIDTNGKNAYQVLDEVRASIVNLDNATASDIMSRIGINPKMLTTLRLSNKEFKEISKARFLSKEQRDNIIALGVSFKKLTMELKLLKDQAVAKITPFLKEMVDGFFKWLRDNGDKIVNIMSMLTEIMGRFILGISRGVLFLSQFIEKITGASDGLKTLSIIVGGLMLYAFSPLIAIITGFLLLLDDIRAWKEGYGSAFGVIYETISQIPNLSDIFGIVAFTIALAKIIPMLKNVAMIIKGAAKWSTIMTGGLQLVAGAAAWYAYENSDKIKEFFGFGSKSENDTMDYNMFARAVNDVGNNYYNNTNSNANQNSTTTIYNNNTFNNTNDPERYFKEQVQQYSLLSPNKTL